ncbi:phosphate transporter [Gymnopilus junonius]|uniref:Phosphate transporter n=1 Tax=Gymnopilus junonius TaxID=109634 RepID=A0A9P5TQ35_GYMJU|nr:phosphate transporter [Gymnopilus junonius]
MDYSHANRRPALAEVDNSRFLRFHAKVCMVAGIGFFASAYNILAIGIASTMLGYVYDPTIRSLKTTQDLALKVAAPIGTVIGQILFGWLADVLGRKRMYGIEMIIIIVATFAQTLVPRIATASTMVAVLGVFRFIAGWIGDRGDYPLSAVITSEFAPTRFRGRMVAVVFGCQGLASLMASLAPFVLIAAYKTSILKSIGAQDGKELAYIDAMWRIVIELGVIPSCIALYSRLTIPETYRFTMDVQRNIAEAIKDIGTSLDGTSCGPGMTVISHNDTVPVASWEDLRLYFSQFQHFKALFGTAYSWFALDVAFYTLNLNSPIILENIAFGKGTDYQDQLSSCDMTDPGIFHVLITSSRGSLILAAAASLPGYLFSIGLIDFWGRKPIQHMGFIVLTILFMIMGMLFCVHDLRLNGMTWFAILYSLATFFQNFGPNTTTFVVPAELFPTRYRATAYGICAACGKLGAIVAQIGFSSIQVNNNDNNKDNTDLQLIAFFMLSGVFSTFLLPETKGKSLEDLAGEKELEESHEEHIPLIQR